MIDVSKSCHHQKISKNSKVIFKVLAKIFKVFFKVLRNGQELTAVNHVRNRGHWVVIRTWLSAFVEEDFPNNFCKYTLTHSCKKALILKLSNEKSFRWIWNWRRSSWTLLSWCIFNCCVRKLIRFGDPTEKTLKLTLEKNEACATPFDQKISPLFGLKSTQNRWARSPFIRKHPPKVARLISSGV